MGLLDKMLTQRKDTNVHMYLVLYKKSFFRLFQIMFFFPNLNERIVNFTLKHVIFDLSFFSCARTHLVS
jgi:hypothetical protein